MPPLVFVLGNIARGGFAFVVFVFFDSHFLDLLFALRLRHLKLHLEYVPY